VVFQHGTNSALGPGIAKTTFPSFAADESRRGAVRVGDTVALDGRWACLSWEATRGIHVFRKIFSARLRSQGRDKWVVEWRYAPIPSRVRSSS